VEETAANTKKSGGSFRDRNEGYTWPDGGIRQAKTSMSSIDDTEATGRNRPSSL
jgi:hypothetical protein